MLLHFLNKRCCALMQWNIQEKTWVWLFYYTDGLPWKTLQQVIFWLDLLASCHCRSLISESPGKSKATTFFLLAVNVCWTLGCVCPWWNTVWHREYLGRGCSRLCPLCWAHPPRPLLGNLPFWQERPGTPDCRSHTKLKRIPRKGKFQPRIFLHLRHFWGSSETHLHFSTFKKQF